MKTHGLRHNIVTGSFTLPVMALLTLAVWVAPDVTDRQLWTGVATAGLTAYLVMELNNRHSLMRIRSRLMSTTYLLLMAATPAFHRWQAVPMLCALSLILAYHALFICYQRTDAQGAVFHAFLVTGAAALLFPPLLALAPVYYFCLLFPLRALTQRAFAAGLIGLALPFGIYAAYAVWQNQTDTAFAFLPEGLRFSRPDYSMLTMGQMVNAGVLVFFTLPAFFHFFHTAYNDKIRTRMLFHCIAATEVVLTAGLALLPQHFDVIFALFIANSSPLLAHYYGLARGRFFHVWFHFTLLSLVALGVYNYVWG